MPYLTVEEIKKNIGVIENDSQKDIGGSRFVGSTDTNRALKYLPKDSVILECGPAFGTFTEFLQKNGYAHIHLLDFVDVLHHGDRKKNPTPNTMSKSAVPVAMAASLIKDSFSATAFGISPAKPACICGWYEGRFIP